MNHREPPHSPAGTRKAWHCLSLLLLVLALHRADALPSSISLRVVVNRSADSLPYLPATGAPALRFQEPPPIPAADRPPVVVAETPLAAATEETSTPATSAGPASTSSPATATAPAVSDNPRPNETTRRPAKNPAPILPDDARPIVRPEDFLPYFQLPGSARQPGDVTLMVPVPMAAPAAPATIPPSSATYTQTPK